jgi:cytochrome c biogenesis protein CcmG, thiol:disulfide interchange protein DsbE
MNRKRLLLVPLALFVGLAVLLASGLRRDPSEIPSPLIAKPAPAFQLATLSDGTQAGQFAPSDLRGQVWLLNVWASWCAGCREEHPALLAFARENSVPIVGLDYKDAPADARKWLARLGNPYRVVPTDRDGRVGIDYGVYGVPETFVVDQRGVIIHKHVGPLTPEVLAQEIAPLLRRATQ